MAPPTKVLYLIDMLPTEGGGTMQYEALFNTLDPDLFVPVVWCELSTAFSRRLIERGISVREEALSDSDVFAPRNPFHLLRKWIFYRRSLHRLRKFILQHGIQIVHGDYHKGAYLAALRSAGLPTILHIRCELYPTLLRLEAFDRTSRTIVLSERFRKLVLSGGVSPEKITKINDGVDTTKFSPSCGTAGTLLEMLGRKDDTVVIGMVARWVRHKRVLEFVSLIPEISRALPSAKFLLVGAHTDGQYEKEILEFIERQGLRDKVVCVDEQKQMERVFNLFDVFVTLAGGAVVLEAMACAKPVVAAAKPSPPGKTIIVPGVTGFLVNHDDLGGLAAKIIELGKDGETRRAFGLNGRQRVQDVFDQKRITKQTEQLYQTLLSTRS